MESVHVGVVIRATRDAVDRYARDPAGLLDGSVTVRADLERLRALLEA